MESKNLLDISWGGILKVVFVLLVVYLLFLIKDILILVIFALVISVLFSPLIDFLQRMKIPRIMATCLVYLLILGGFGLFIYLISLSFVPEIQQFAEAFPQYFERIAPSLKGLGVEFFENFDALIKASEEWLKEASASIINALFVFFGGIFSALFIIFLSFFFSLEEKGVEKAIRIFFPKKQENLALKVWNNSQKKISGWFTARAFCCLFVGLASFVALKLFKIDYAFSFSLFAGITNIIPFLGPFFAGAVITILVFLDNWLKAVFILIAFILIQQIEGSILSPVLTKRFIGLPPALVLISLIIGVKLWGLLGAILIIPLAGILFEFIKDFLKKNKERYDSLDQEEPPEAIVM